MHHEIHFPLAMPKDLSNFLAQVIKLSITDARYGEKFWVAALQHC